MACAHFARSIVAVRLLSTCGHAASASSVAVRVAARRDQIVVHDFVAAHLVRRAVGRLVAFAFDHEASTLQEPTHAMSSFQRIGATHVEEKHARPAAQSAFVTQPPPAGTLPLLVVPVVPPVAPPRAPPPAFAPTLPPAARPMTPVPPVPPVGREHMSAGTACGEHDYGMQLAAHAKPPMAARRRVRASSMPMPMARAMRDDPP